MKEKIAQFLWPPLRANRENRLIRTRLQQKAEVALWTSINDNVFTALKNHKNLTESSNAAAELVESEGRRKDTIEAKASVIVQSAGIATSIIALAPAVLDKKWVLSFWWSVAVLALYIVGIVHLLTAVYYAANARRVGTFAMPSADGLINLLKRSSENLERKLIAQKITDAKWNEDALTIKMNLLSVAEDLFLRGLAFFAASVTIAILWTAIIHAWQ